MSSLYGTGFQLAALRFLDASSRSIFGALERLATGQRLNRASDGPADLIASENLRATLAGLDAEVRSLERAGQTANVADAALGSTSDLLIEASGLVATAANSSGLSMEEKQALQAELDSILASVDGIAEHTTFNGQKLLDGNATISAGGSSVDLPSASSGDLGTTEIDGETYTLSDLAGGGALNLVDGDLEAAGQVIRQAINEVAEARGSVGSFQLHATTSGISRALTSIETVSAANSLIRDTDYARETVELFRARVLHQAAMQTVRMMGSLQTGILDLLG